MLAVTFQESTFSCWSDLHFQLILESTRRACHLMLNGPATWTCFCWLKVTVEDRICHQNLLESLCFFVPSRKALRFTLALENLQLDYRSDICITLIYINWEEMWKIPTRWKDVNLDLELVFTRIFAGKNWLKPHANTQNKNSFNSPCATCPPWCVKSRGSVRHWRSCEW